MRIIEKYTGNKTYMFPSGVIATPEVMLSEFPAILTFGHIIETDESGEMCYAVNNLNAMRSMYEIDKSLTEDEAIAKIQEIITVDLPKPRDRNLPEFIDIRNHILSLGRAQAKIQEKG